MEKIDWDKAYKIFYSDKENLLNLLNREVDRYPYVKEILLILAAGTLISAALLMPGLGKILNPGIWDGKGYRKNRLRQVLKRLERKKIVEVVETKDGPVVRITQGGITKSLKYKLDDMTVKKKNWDKKWRIVVFDISEEKKRSRDEFRERLKQIGFFPLQESVYVHAFPCFDEVEFLRQVYGVDIEVTYITAEKIEQNENLKEFFNLT